MLMFIWQIMELTMKLTVKMTPWCHYDYEFVIILSKMCQYQPQIIWCLPGGRWHCRNVPEPIGRMMNWPSKTSLRWQIRCQRGQSFGVVRWVVGEFNGDWFSWSFRDGIVQMFNCSFGFNPLVITNESHSFWQTCIGTDFRKHRTIYNQIN